MCLKSKPNFSFQTHFEKVSEYQTLSLDFRQCLKSKMVGNQTVFECLKSILHSLDFRLYYIHTYSSFNALWLFCLSNYLDLMLCFFIQGSISYLNFDIVNAKKRCLKYQKPSTLNAKIRIVILSAKILHVLSKIFLEFEMPK